MRHKLMGAGAIVATLIAVVLVARAPGAPGTPPRAAPWYHATDPALLHGSQLPQLVEFFHPD